MTRLHHEVHPFVQVPSEAPFPLCICGLADTHHLHAGISSAICTYMCCYRVRHPEEFPPHPAYPPVGEGDSPQVGEVS